MKRSCVLALVTSLTWAGVAQANLLADGGFEAATTGTQTSNSAWVLSGNMPDGTNPSAQFQNANWSSNPNGVPGTGVWFKAFEGNQAAGVDPLAQADLHQTVAAVAGGDYALTFYAKREANFSAGQWITSLSSSGTGGSASIDLLATVPTDGNWYLYNLNLSGVTPGDMLTVRTAMIDGIDALVNPQSAFVDDYDLTARIPEPAALGLAGLGLLSTLIRRRR